MKSNLLAAGLLLSLAAQAQTLIHLPIGDPSEQIIERRKLQNADLNGYHSSIKPLLRREIVQQLRPVDTLSAILPILYADEYFIQKDNPRTYPYIRSRKPFLKHLYKSPAHLYEYEGEDFYFNINPMLHLEAGGASNGDSSSLVYNNMRGLSLAGEIGKKIAFYTEVLETQMVAPDYVNGFVARNNAVPNAGFYKPFSSRFAPNSGGYDYLLASGYISADLHKYINLQFGNGRNFIGDGQRSLLLSNFSNNYNYLKLRTSYKFIQYQNLFCELVGDHLPVANVRVPRKYMSLHYLSLNLGKKLNIGLYESVTFGGRSGFELSYLNPILFFRAAEQGLGSPDNVILGTTAKYNLLKRFVLYGQLVLDELVFNEMFVNRQNWWGNKYGFQLGAKYIDAFGVQNLLLQAEYNRVRPYTYTFKDSTANFTHYNQPLAHPLGANFSELLLVARYDWNYKASIELKTAFIQQGLDTAGSNWGGNLHPSYTSRMQEYGNLQNQGVLTHTVWAQAKVEYMLKQQLYVYLQALHRRQSDNSSPSKQLNMINLGIRYRFAPVDRIF